jgi:hypothetical protein
MASSNQTNDVFYVYVGPIVGSIGLLFELICFIVLSNKEFNGTLFKYLKYQVIFEAIDLLIGVLRPIHDCKTCPISKTYYSQLHFLITIVYLASVCEMSALMCQIASVYHCLKLISINKQFTFSKSFLAKHLHRVIVFLIFFYSALLFSYQLLQYRIIHKEDTDSYELVDSSDFDPSLWLVCESISFGIRDLVLLIILISLNLLLFFKVKQNIKHKIFVINFNIRHKISTIQPFNSDFNHNNQSTDKLFTINGNDSNYKRTKQIENETPSTPVIRQIEKFENRIAFMIIISSINYVLGRIPILLFFIIRNFNKGPEMGPFLNFAVFQIYFSYSIEFFIFYFMNKRFKIVFLKILKRVFKIIHL